MIINEVFGGILGEEIPTHTTIRDWCMKAGLAKYNEAGEEIKESGKDNAAIVDESITVGSQKLMLTLGVPAEYPGHPLSRSDVKCLGMSVAPSRKAEDVTVQLEKDTTGKVGKAPVYVISDGGSNLRRGVRDAGMRWHYDVSHAMGVILKDVYEKEEDFMEFNELMGKVRLSCHLTERAYLLPPNLRSAQARFMNFFHWVDWAGRTINVYDSLSPKMKETLAFVKEHKSLIDELRKVMNCIEGILDMCKNKGLSKFTSLHCKYAASKELVSPRDATKRMRKVGCKIAEYFMQEEKLLESDTARHNISSDIIESIFGEYKDRKSPNKLCGVTSYVLVLPLFGCLKTREDRLAFDFKAKMEAVRLADIKEWKDLNLLDNWAQKRTEILGKAS